MTQNLNFYRSPIFFRAAAAALLAGAPVYADDGPTLSRRYVASLDVAPVADKSRYHLFNPTPASEMRELSTDRPDATESPYTVDAGHIQIEMSLLEYTRDARNDTFAIAPTNFKLGLLNKLDLQVVVNPYTYARTRENGTTRKQDGLGDTDVRVKLNLWGNDEGATALALMPFVRIPTGTGGQSVKHVETGLIVPFGMTLGELYVGVMLEVDMIRNADDSGYGCEIVHTVTLGHPIWEKLSGFVEYAGTSPISTGGTYLATFNTGVTYALTENVQLDAGVRVGLSGRAEDFTSFVGLTLRF